MKIKPINNYVLVDPVIVKKTKAGIEIPEKYWQKPRKGYVLDVGNQVKYGIKKGDEIRMPPYRLTEVIVENKLYFLIKDEEILLKTI